MDGVDRLVRDSGACGFLFQEGAGVLTCSHLSYEERGQACGAAPRGGVGVQLDTRSAIDRTAELARLTKDRAAAEKEAAQCRAKLENPSFTDRAPQDVVDKIRERLAAAEADLNRIDAAMEALNA